MFYTDEEFKQIEELKNEIVPIITNKAGTMSPSLIQLCETIGHQHWPSFCTKCSSGRFNLITRIYYRLIEDENEKTKNKPQTKNGKEEKSGDGKSVSKSNRKSSKTQE